MPAQAGIRRLCRCLGGKGLQPFLGETVAMVGRQGKLVLDEEAKGRVLPVSAATIDRRPQAPEEEFPVSCEPEKSSRLREGKRLLTDGTWEDKSNNPYWKGENYNNI